MSYFYSHLIEIETLLVELDDLDLSEKERHHLAHLLDQSLHHTILDAVLSQLEDQDKDIFLSHLNKGEDLKTWEFLNSKIDKIEEKIKQSALELKTKLHQDIKEVKEKKI